MRLANVTYAELYEQGGRDVDVKKQIEDFGVPKEDVEATHGLLGQVFNGLKINF